MFPALLLVHGSVFAPATAFISGLTSDASTGEILIQDFANPTFDWDAVTDQVMGGRSTSDLNIENGVAHLTGKCDTLPFRDSPGFVSLRGGQHWSWDGDDKRNETKNNFPDLHHCDGLKVVLKSNVAYAGYHVDIGMRSSHTHGWGYKSQPVSAPTDDFGEINLPFNTFSINTGHHHRHQQTQQDNGATEDNLCSSTNKDACPDTETLCNMKSISILGDGVVGDIDLEIKSIHAFGCNSDHEAAGTCLKKEEGAPSGNTRSMERQKGNWKKNVFWFTMGIVLTVAAAVYVLTQGQTNSRRPCSWSWAVPAGEEVPVVPAPPVSELA